MSPSLSPTEMPASLLSTNLDLTHSLVPHLIKNKIFMLVVVTTIFSFYTFEPNKPTSLIRPIQCQPRQLLLHNRCRKAIPFFNRLVPHRAEAARALRAGAQKESLRRVTEPICCCSLVIANCPNTRAGFLANFQAQ